MKTKKWLWAFAVLPLVCVPLVAQEQKTGDPEATPAEPPTEGKPDAASQQQPDPPEERVSADNNLSFPVDI